jgi:hypothetical protein
MKVWVWIFLSLIAVTPMSAQVTGTETSPPTGVDAPRGTQRLKIVTESVTTNYLPKFNGTTTSDLTDSLISDDGATVTIRGGFVRFPGNWRRLMFHYAEVAGNGSDLTGQMGNTRQSLWAGTARARTTALLERPAAECCISMTASRSSSEGCWTARVPGGSAPRQRILV